MYIYIYICVCMYASIFVYVCLCVAVCIYTYTCKYMRIIYVDMYTPLREQLYCVIGLYGCIGG